jgi:hypothetical protein
VKYRWFVGVIAVGAVARSRCGGDDRPIDLDAVNALVPPDVDLVFEKRELIQGSGFDKTRYTLAAPQGWKPGYEGMAILVHPSYVHTHVHVGKTCDGWCEPKDWNETIDEAYAYYLRGTVIKDVRGTNSRTLIAQDPRGEITVTLVADWKPGADHYNSCDSSLQHELQTAALAFEKACEVVHQR